ncbi:SNF1-interacting protein [Elasticomyces elasticus]|uniref:SNF1-interacting protein n=1 Tax=Exophiala sideris TaxID=1016849 RepID=A0ABR0JCH0_9EURO|nr:SNF1-interacting protein [Elasticomyces elasticus]KAK5032105.1 SNF1-interacting protein [Exophiala sideris]KAK5041032.1 SNF1-interacting protein [Exophiala sideris]KAK5061634.1 SNF1-interacting protein [Exophiala sideris]KAK5184333.1 SNF1-interacting protein [Eurotiomycetes sp. CCFEE 6388]
MSETLQPANDVGRLINLVPVGLKEAAIDSPTSRATVVHYGEQVELLEKWLDDYFKATNRLVAESLTLENVLNSFISHSVLPLTISESMLDHDYSTLAMKKYGEGAKDYWMSAVGVVKKLTTMVSDPIRQFMTNDLRAFKDVRRAVEASQKTFEHLQSKYAGLGKSKEPSSLREDAFQLHEARKTYLHAMMDFYSLIPQFRFALDRLLVQIFFEQWKEMRVSRDNTAATVQRSAGEMQRVRGWLNEMEASERTFRKELLTAKKELEEAAELSTRPSRELDDYSLSTIPQFSSHAHTTGGMSQSSPKKVAPRTGEKQGWLFLRTYGGKPTRTIWVHRWAFIRNGVFGWLLQSARAGGVEESERIGVLLCNVRPAPAEERRFCFELKTNKNTILLQAETQAELVEWIGAFESAKSKALEDPNATQNLSGGGNIQTGAAFAISAPPIPEFGTYVLGSTEPGTAGDDIAALEKSNTLPVPGSEAARESSVDLPRRSTAVEEGGHRDTASRIISKLDLHRKSAASPLVSPTPSTPNLPAGGIASLIAASHGSMPVGPAIPMVQNPELDVRPRHTFTLALRDMPPSTLAPATLAAVPSPTNLSKAAVIVTGERGLSPAPYKSGIPTSLIANLWGTSNTALVNRLERSEPKTHPEIKLATQPSPVFKTSPSPPNPSPSPPRRPGMPHTAVSQLDLSIPQNFTRSRTPSPSKRHRSTISVDRDAFRHIESDLLVSEFPNYYPLQLKSQDAQFRLLFPDVRRDERLVMVFRATWNPNEQQEFPGRVYVTSKDLYFYSNHMGLVLTTSLPLGSIEEATAAPGRDCDFVFLHLTEPGSDGSNRRITLKTFLEPLKLLQKRLNFLIKNSVSQEPLELEELIKALLKMESESGDRSPSLESWEDVSPNTPVDTGGLRYRDRASTIGTEVRAPLRVDRALHQTQLGRRESKFKLPAQPVKYVPTGNLRLATEKEFDISAKALFHVMFGDKTAIWQLLQHERRAKNLNQGPWLSLGEGRLRREFAFDIPTTTILGQGAWAHVRDYQVVDVNSDHLCYVVTDKRTPWHLPFQDRYRLVSKIVITHVAKAKCKLALFIKLEWTSSAGVLGGMLERQALYDLELDSLDLADLVADQVRKLGAHSRTKKAVQIFGQVGHASETTQLIVNDSAFAIELRRPPFQTTITGLLSRRAASASQSAVAMALASITDFVKWMNKTLSANKFILIALLLSALYNSWHTYRDSLGWWHERRASKFMARLGVSPDVVMSRAVYLNDLDEVLHYDASMPVGDSSACYSVFSDAHDPEVIHAGDRNGGDAQFQQTRQRLRVYRHDLLVAVRVVNGIEKELMQSAWEQWVVDENRRCNVVEGLVLNDVAHNATDVGEDVKSWYDEYCVSCREEYNKIKI